MATVVMNHVQAIISLLKLCYVICIYDYMRFLLFIHLRNLNFPLAQILNLPQKYIFFQILEPRFKPIQVVPAAAAAEQSMTTQTSTITTISTQKQILKLRSNSELDDVTTRRWMASPSQAQFSDEEKLMEEFLTCVENSTQHFDFPENKVLSTPTTLSLGSI